MTKRVMLPLFVLMALLLAVTPALAAAAGDQNQHKNQFRNRVGGQPQALLGGQSFSLTGTISALGENSITVLVYNGSRLVKPYIGQDLIVLVTQNTRYRQWAPGGCTPITFGDLQVGDTTSVEGKVSGDVFTAQRVTVDVPCCTP